MKAKLLALTAVVLVAWIACDGPPPPPSPVVTTGAAAPPAPPQPPVQPLGPQAWKTTTSADGGFTARWSTVPDPIVARDPFVVTVELFVDSACTTPLVGGELALDAAMPHHGHGMNVRPKMTAIGAGRYRAEGMLFHMPGRWELFFDRTVDGQTERAQTTLMLELGKLEASP